MSIYDQNGIQRGREVFFNLNKNTAISTAIDTFNARLGEADVKLIALQGACYAAACNIYSYSTYSHRFSQVLPHMVSDSLKIDENHKDKFRKDYLDHVLFPQFFEAIFPDECSVQDQNDLKAFIEYKLQTPNKWKKSANKVKVSKFCSNQQKQEKIQQRDYEKTPQGHIEKLQKDLQALKNLPPLSTEEIVQPFQEVKLDVILKALENEKLTPAHTDNIRNFKKSLKSLLEKIQDLTVSQEDLKSFINWKSASNVPDSWKEFEGDEPNVKPYKQFLKPFQNLMNTYWERETQIQNLNEEIDGLTTSAAPKASTPVEQEPEKQPIAPQEVAEVEEPEQPIAPPIPELEKEPEPQKEGDFVWMSKVQNFFERIWNQTFVRLWNFLNN